MSDSVMARAAAGVSFLFAPGERPDGSAIREALDASQARAQIVREDQASGSSELVLDGLAFDVDGLAPAQAANSAGEPQSADPSRGSAIDGLEAVRLYPGHHLSGGSRMAPVVRALIALAAELAVRLPARAVCWHPAGTEVEPQAFAHAAWAWLAGGAFPARVLTALTILSDGSVVSRGLAHFVGQEIALRPGPSEGEDNAMQLAAQIVAHLVLHGPVTAITETVVAGEMLCFEPSQRETQLWVWRSGA